MSEPALDQQAPHANGAQDASQQPAATPPATSGDAAQLQAYAQAQLEAQMLAQQQMQQQAAAAASQGAQGTQGAQGVQGNQGLASADGMHLGHQGHPGHPSAAAMAGYPAADPMMQPGVANPMAGHMQAPHQHMMDPAMAAAYGGMQPGVPSEPGAYAQVAQPEMDPASAQMAAQAAAYEAGGYAGTEDLSNIRPVPRVAIQAFCETPSVVQTIEQAGLDRRMGKAHVKAQLGGVMAAVEFYQTATTPNLIIVETRKSGGELLGELEQLAEVCDEGTNVVVVGHRNDVQMYRDLISRGVAEYLVAPVSMSDVMEIVTTLFVNPDASPLGTSYAFVGARGGVGSSTVAHNIAWAISSNFSSDVVLADFDLAFGTANIDFDQDPAQGVAEAVFSSDRIDDTFLDRLLAKCTDHLSLLAAPSTLNREYDFGASDFNQLIEVAQRSTPNVILDLPHAWTGWTREVLANADKVILTATPDLASLRNSKNLVDTLNELRPNDEKPFLVLNQCNMPKRPEISAEEFAGPLGIEPSVVIDFDPAIFGLAANNGQMVSETDPKHAAAAAFDSLANILTGRREIEAPAKKSSMSDLLSKFTKKKK
ncbi:MAG: CpaE family protein [Pseudomonadota bacterium]